MIILSNAQIRQLVADIEAHDAEIATQRSNVEVVNIDDNVSLVVEEVTHSSTDEADVPFNDFSCITLMGETPQGTLCSPCSDTSFAFKSSAGSNTSCETPWPHLCLKYHPASAGEVALLTHHFQQQREARNNKHHIRNFRAYAEWNPLGMGNGGSPLRHEIKPENLEEEIPRAIPLRQRVSSFFSSSSEDSD
jgi:hypothetical protein